MADLRRLGYRLSEALAGPWLSVVDRSRSLRVLAYHRVSDATAFEQQISFLVENFDPVGASEVSHGVASTLKRPLWVTFDDGDRSLVDVALPVLESFGIHSTAFVCPGVVGSTEPWWWDVVAYASENSIEVEGVKVQANELAILKSVPDDRRRLRVEKIRTALDEARLGPLHGNHIDTEGLNRWSESQTVGNHTWDHPLLDQCDESDQESQIQRGHDWLVDEFNPEDLLFAYPNGNYASPAAEKLADLGYRIGVLFDHRLHRGGPSLKTSRIRVNADDPLSEFKAKVVGIHPWAHRVLDMRKGVH